MKRHQILLFIFLFSSLTLFAQKPSPVFLKESTLRINPNITLAVIDSFNENTARANNKVFALMQFESIPTEAVRKELERGGVFLLDYIPDNAYTVTINGAVSFQLLKNAGAKLLISLEPEQKMHPALTKGNVPGWATKVQGTIDVLISFPKTFSPAEVQQLLKEKGFQIIATELSAYRVLSLRIAINRITELASYPFVEYVQPVPGSNQPLNQNSKAGSRANVLTTSIANGGKGLTGEGVVVGVGDNSDVQTHADFSRRIINRAATVSTGHGHHVTGIVAGAGNVNELYRGYAPKATIVSQFFSGILSNAATYVQDYGMVITNNSYGNINECDYHGTYDLYSRILDQQAFDLPNLEHVFAAGNSGGATCFPNDRGFRTVYGGYQSAKNVVTVGATNDSGSLATLSSKGPVRDGRTKPDIAAMGEFVGSAGAGNSYYYNTGTSMAAPAVSGGLALLYQRYKQLHNGSNPKSGLMKALVCNGATDRGNAGPDFGYGFGWLNLLRSVEMVERNHYFVNTVTGGSSASHTISVPANTAGIKIMLYWHDPAASLLSKQTLVNDLDLEVTSPSAAVHYPKILDTTIAGVTKVATTGPDHINNTEQVVIDNPTAGNYTISIKGTTITQNPAQEYFVVYDILPVSMQLTYPMGGEALAPSNTYLDPVKITWDAFGNSSETYTIQFSSDGGTAWTDLATGIEGGRRIFTWWVPDIATDRAVIRIIQSGSGFVSISKPFTIINVPALSLAPVQCEGYAAVTWNAINGATDYEVMMLQGEEMKPVGTTTELSYTISGLLKDSTYFISVRPLINGKPGRRAVALIRKPEGGNCAGSISDNDLKLEAITSPASGRKATSSELSSATPITIKIKNLDDAPVSNFRVSYSVNGSGWITENVTLSIAPGAVYDYTFVTPFNFSPVGDYNFTAVVKNTAADRVMVNDTLTRLIKQLSNNSINLATPFLDNIETAITEIYSKDTIGLKGLDRYDFENNTEVGRLRTFVNTGMAYSGAKALTLDADRLYQPGNTNFLTGTFNVGGYNVVTNDLRLDFQYNNHGQVSHRDNKVWIRGSDNQPWVEVYDLHANGEEPGIYKKTSSIELSDLLANNAQNFSSSFQIRWGQYGQTQATDKEAAAGYTFDDIRLYQVFNDLQLLRIDNPVTVSCGLSTTNAIKISVRNSANTTLTNIPVKYRLNNGAWVNEIIPSISGNTTLAYTFTTTANLSAIGSYEIQTVVDYPGDSFRDNDTAKVTIINSPVITLFPHLQNFEKDNGSWYADGKNSSWEYGTPASAKVNRAASGAKAWKTRLSGNYNDGEISYLYSPCYDIGGMTAPTLSFSMTLDLEDCGTTLCDGAWMEYSTDGVTWKKLGTAGNGTNWYNQASDNLWSRQNFTRWHVATIPLPAGLPRLRLRFVLQADPGVNREGIAIDDIHIYDNTKGIYDGITTAPVIKTVSGSTWIDFENGGKLIASILPNNQNLGATEVQAYLTAGSVRHFNNQYYVNRNITIKPTTISVADSVRVRYYFLESETDSLIKGNSCATCVVPASAYELGISKYSDINDDLENGTVDDNLKGLWAFINGSKVAIVPFDKGYYAEFTVTDFSEFWLSKSSIGNIIANRVQLIDFTAQKATGNNDVLLKWTVKDEGSVLRYEVEVARSNEDLQKNNFVKIGAQNSAGNTTAQQSYSFIDAEMLKTGIRYYRLKIINVDGSFSYSETKPVQFSDVFTWQVFPNPSTGVFYFTYQLPAGNTLQAKVTDATGRVVKEYKLSGNGFVQKATIDLSNGIYASGVYLLQAPLNGLKNTFKLYKQ